MNTSVKKPKHTIGRAEEIDFPDFGYIKIPARIDTGAKTSSVWATEILEEADGGLSFVLFGRGAIGYDGRRHYVKRYEKVVVASTIGEAQERYKIKIRVKLDGRTINASFTLADRSKQVYPVLVGRNILTGKFIVDVEHGKALTDKENARNESLQSLISSGKGDKV